MKFNLSKSMLKKILMGTTILNYILLITYVFLLITAFVYENYAFFIISIPAYILSNSWLFLLGFFGFEIFLITYYWYKDKQSKNTENSISTNTNIHNSFQEEISEDIFDDILDFDQQNEIGLDEHENIQLEEELEYPEFNNFDSAENDLATIEAEQDFNILWEEAIKHIELATSNDKKKVGELVKTEEKNSIQVELPLPVEEIKHKNKTSNPKNNFSLQKNLKKETIKDSANSYSLIKEPHRELYNQIAINNWIYEKKSDREVVGLYKLSLNETPFREKDISYLVEAGVINKMLIPLPMRSFYIYSIYENEAKKIVKYYLTNLCKNYNFPFTQKTISIVNYQDLGLDKKIWRLDFQIGREIIGLILIYDFLIFDEMTDTYSLSFDTKKELKALLATSQLHEQNKEMAALIVTDSNESKKLIEEYLLSTGYGQAQILAIGETKFDEEFLTLVKNNISTRK